MRFRIMPTRPESPPEPVLLFKLEQRAAGIAVIAQLEGDPEAKARVILTIGEEGIRRCDWVGGLGLPTEGADRVVDCTGGE